VLRQNSVALETRPLRSRLLASLAAAVWALCGGCGRSGPERFAIGGQVTLDGVPIADGEILLRPDATTAGPTAAATIENGTYFIPADRGPIAGNYSVVITAQRKTGKKVQSEMIGAATTDQYEQYVPIKYNDATTLAATIDRSRDDLDFALSSKE
jgi:hypothetical protein